MTRYGAFDAELLLESVSNPRFWMVRRTLVWTGTQGDRIEVPSGFLTDLATVPRFLHWAVLPYGPYTRAAVLHDWLLVSLAQGDRTFTSRDIDGMFRRVMQDLGTPWAVRWLMWAAVRWAALFNGRRAYGRGFARDLPAVLGISLLALIFIPPGALGVSISLLLLKLIGV